MEQRIRRQAVDLIQRANGPARDFIIQQVDGLRRCVRVGTDVCVASGPRQGVQAEILPLIRVVREVLELTQECIAIRSARML